MCAHLQDWCQTDVRVSSLPGGTRTYPRNGYLLVYAKTELVGNKNGLLKVIPRKKGAPRIFAHYHKIYNSCQIVMKLGENF